MKQVMILVSVLLIAAAATLLQSRDAHSTTAQLPSFVVKDSVGDVLGPVVDLSSGVAPIVLLKDPVNGDQFTLFVRRNWFRTTDVLEVWYDNIDCTGTAYIEEPDNASSSQLPELRRSIYGVGKNSRIFTNNFAAGTGSNHSSIIESKWRTTNNAAGQCQTGTTSADTIEAAEVLDLSSFTAPFSVE